MKNWRLSNINQSAFEKTGPVPRSITKTFEKFKKELEPNSESEIIEEFRVSRYQTAASIKYLVLLIAVPVIVVVPVKPSWPAKDIEVLFALSKVVIPPPQT